MFVFFNWIKGKGDRLNVFVVLTCYQRTELKRHRLNRDIMHLAEHLHTVTFTYTNDSQQIALGSKGLLRRTYECKRVIK